MALFAPKLILYTAYSQYSEAYKLIKELNSIRSGSGNGTPTNGIKKGISSANVFGTSNGTSSSTSKYKLRYGFFIIMGGCITKNVK